MRIDRYEFRAATEDEENAAKACLRVHTCGTGGIVINDEPFSVLALSENRVIGGVIGKVFWNWLSANLVWVEEPFRGCGIGKAVLQRAEEKARERGLTGVHLWTQTWQAPNFYRKLGYEQYAEFDNFPPGHKRLGFRKYF
jgi:GNAT superfamily N-acetyltransferase